MPPARIVRGDLAALEDALAGSVAAARASSSPLAPVTVLVGSVLQRPYLQRMLARRGVAQLNVRFLRPNELARAMAGDGGRVRLTAGAERLLVREVAGGAAASPSSYFAPVAHRDGFAEMLQRLVREIELGGFDAAALRTSLGDATDDADSKEAALAALYDEYRARTGAFASTAQAYDAALRATLDGPLYVYGLSAPSELQARLIEHVAATSATAGDVTVFLPHAGIAEIDGAYEAFRARLLAGGAVEERRESPASPDGVLARVRGTLFRIGDAPAAGASHADRGETTSVQLVNAPDTVREIWEAARACLRWAGEGIRFHEMAVVYRNRDPYRALIDEIFSEAHIETYLHDGRLLSTHPLGRRLLSLLQLAASHERFGRAEVMEFLTETQLPRQTRAKYRRVRPSEWESYTREAGVVEGIAQWRSRLTRLVEEKRLQAQDERFDWMNDVADRIGVLIAFAGDLHGALSSHPADATWDDHIAYARDLASKYADGVEPLLEAIDELKSLAAVRERVPFDVFCRAVRDDFESRDTTDVLKEPVRLFGRQGVAVIDASSLRHLRFRAVYLVGVAERAWPPPSRPDPLLLERERRRINESAAGAGAGALPLRTEPDEESAGFWLAAQSAQEHLAISYARADAGRSGKHLPSYFFRAVAESLEGRRLLTLDELDASAYVRRFEAGRLACAELADSLSAAEYDRGLMRASYERGLAAGIDAVAAVSPEFGRALVARNARRGGVLSSYDGVMAGDDATAAARNESIFQKDDASVSPSRLEMYATCPYRYFLRYVLRIEPVEEPETVERIDHLQRGSLIHEILQRFLERTGRDDPPNAARRDEHLRLLLQISRECGEDREQRGVTGRPLIWKMDRQQIDDDLTRWYDEEVKDAETSGMKPGAFEARFGPAWGPREGEAPLSSDDPLVLDAGGRTLRLQGRIDRVDWDEAHARFRVIDYKTGKTRPGKDDVLKRGEALQLPVYLHAAAQLTGIDASRGESQYFFVSSAGGFKRHVITGATLAERAADFQRVLSTIADGVDAGYFAPNPGDKQTNCRYCDYKDVCDARIGPIMDSKAGDSRGDAYRALGDIS